MYKRQVILGAMVSLMNRAGGSAAFGEWAGQHIKLSLIHILSEWQQDQYVKLEKNEDYQPSKDASTGIAGEKKAATETLYFDEMCIRDRYQLMTVQDVGHVLMYVRARRVRKLLL